MAASDCPSQEPEDAQVLLEHLGRVSDTEVTRALEQLFELLEHDVEVACTAFLRRSGVPSWMMSAQELTQEVWWLARQNAPRFEPKAGLSAAAGRSNAIAWIVKPGQWIAAEQAGELSQRLSFEIDAEHEPDAFEVAGQEAFEADAQFSDEPTSAPKPTAEIIAKLRPRDRAVLLCWARHLEWVRVESERSKGPAHDAHDDRPVARWEWRVPSGKWKDIAMELGMKVPAAKKAVSRATARLEEACAGDVPQWVKRRPDTDDEEL